ncbi:hypothetical protein IFR05_002690 [Cadophora sp. M221]|nr:hypothetical protein IFR05_002690 [Cadophora sp. M221]
MNERAENMVMGPVVNQGTTGSLDYSGPRTGNAFNRAKKETVTKDVVNELLNIHGYKAYYFSYEDIIAHLLQGEPFPTTYRHSRESTGIKGTTTMQVRMALDKATEIRKRRMYGEVFPPTRAPRTPYIPRFNNTKRGSGRHFNITRDNLRVDAGRGVQVNAMMESSARGSVGKIATTEDEDNEDGSESLIGEKTSSGDKTRRDHQSSSGDRNPRSAADYFEEKAVAEGGDPSDGDSCSGSSGEESDEDSDNGADGDSESDSKEVAGDDVDEDRHGFEISRIQTKIIVQLEATIARLEQEKQEAMDPASRMGAQQGRLTRKLADGEADLTQAHRINIILRKTLENTDLVIQNKDVDIASLQTRERLALVLKDDAEKRCVKQAKRITAIEEELDTSNREFELSRDEGQQSQAEADRTKKFWKTPRRRSTVFRH